MRVLVTGGHGYLGNAVCRALGDTGHHVTMLSRRSGIDVRDRVGVAGAVEAAQPEAVCHLAALTRPRDSFADPLSYFDVNVGGTLNLLLALDRPVPFVLASSSIVYGGQHTGALTEDLPVNPESPYAASKVAAEQLVAAHAATGAVGGVVLRCFNIAGAAGGVGDTDTTRIIPNVFRAITGQLPHVTLNGDGSATRDFVHVEDVAQAVVNAIERATPGEAETYNIASGVGTSMAGIVAAAEAVTGKKVEIKRLSPKPEPPHLVADIARARAELGWEPHRSTPDRIVTDAWAAWAAA
ncbi:UDP-glucose 4-epimerase GalE [Phytohabitans flavus]|uniref:UDP-glucose 4-epimerase n=1 Tax=Phytohabitans flavus TaxID=1076124 RepID=A0A6F8Y3W0_9ACTN|nr:NAD-dependent epimerase/dehydratase family protein [Phytohabitans flavus]BCB80719.1 UDP-glucose 4-epimerase GalE [Phytohabitans flavus]